MQQTTNRTYVSPATEVLCMTDSYLMAMPGTGGAAQPSAPAPIRHPIDVYG